MTAVLTWLHVRERRDERSEVMRRPDICQRRVEEEAERIKGCAVANELAAHSKLLTRHRGQFSLQQIIL